MLCFSACCGAGTWLMTLSSMSSVFCCCWRQSGAYKLVHLMTCVVNMDLGDNYQRVYQARQRYRWSCPCAWLNIMKTQYAPGLHSFAPGIDLSVHRGSVLEKTMKRSPSVCNVWRLSTRIWEAISSELNYGCGNIFRGPWKWRHYRCSFIQETGDLRVYW
jgi:hypothetical protein